MIRIPLNTSAVKKPNPSVPLCNLRVALWLKKIRSAFPVFGETPISSIDIIIGQNPETFGIYDPKTNGLATYGF